MKRYFCTICVQVLVVCYSYVFCISIEGVVEI